MYPEIQNTPVLVNPRYFYVALKFSFEISSEVDNITIL